MKLPDHIGGLQHLADDVIVKADDVLVSNGVPVDFCHEWAGETVAQVEAGELCRVYRRIPVAKQGDLDHPPIQLPTEPDPDSAQRLREAVFGKTIPEDIAPFQDEVDRQFAALPTDAKARKQIPLASGLLDYFPLALCAVAELSRIGNDQHNPGKPLHWDRSKSGDEADALMRHLLQRNETDKDGVEHAVKVAWRALALAQKRLEGLKK